MRSENSNNNIKIYSLLLKNHCKPLSKSTKNYNIVEAANSIYNFFFFEKRTNE